MKKLLMLSGAAALGLGLQSAAHAYSATGSVTFSWGGSVFGAATDSIWTSSVANTLGTVANSTYFSTLTGGAVSGYVNSDFATSTYCSGLGITVSGSPDTFAVRKYGCRFTGSGFKARAVADNGPGASASGTIAVTDTTLTGTLTINATTNEPTGATTTFINSVRISNSAGNGATGYNLRAADGSPFGNAWYGISTSGTYTLNLTGTFTASTWNITGGSADFSDPLFACQNGDSASGSQGTLCTNSTTMGVFEGDGGALAWGSDADGTGTGGVGEISVKDAGGAVELETLSGVLANLSIAAGSITTNSGEIRRAQSNGGVCDGHIRYNGTKISCGALTATQLVITGTVNEVPVPAAAWLIAPAVLAAGRFARRRRSA